MKTCPVCKTALFEDMPVCYGCMYEFGSRPELERQAAQVAAGEAEEGDAASEGLWEASAPSGAGPAQDAPVGDSRPAFMRRSALEAAGGAPAPERAPWTIRLEMRSEDDPRTTWSMELLPAGRRASGERPQISSR